LKNKHLHIISFDVPYPADYGGVIDVFHKIRHLHLQGIQITLHCFKYGREESEELKKYCDQVYYYQRRTSKKKIIHKDPFIVITRDHPDLLARLKMHDSPILFEGLHSTFLLAHPELEKRKKIVRMHNIEHEYYRFLSQFETSIFRKMYLLSESLKLASYEKILKHADLIFAISMLDTQVLQSKYGHTSFVSAFHQYDEVITKTGLGNYSLYHGNLKVPENEKAVLFLIDEVANQLEHQLIIAGQQASSSIRKKCKSKSNILLIENPSEQEMQSLIQNAQVHLLPSFQQSGIKLKLLHALYCGRHVIVNKNMLSGTSLEKTCIQAESAKEFASLANSYSKKEFKEELLEERKTILQSNYSNASNAKKLISLVFQNDSSGERAH